MSAYKTAIVRLGEAEYRRLRAAEEELHQLETLHENRTSQGNLSIYDRILADSRARDEQFNHLVAELDEAAQEGAQRAEQWLAAQNLETEAKLAEAEQNAVQWLEQISTEMAERQNEVESQLAFQTELNEQIILQAESQLAQQINNQFAERQSLAEAETAEAMKWIEAGRKLLDYLPNHYAFDIQSANDLEFFRDNFNQAINAYNAGNYRESCHTAHMVFNDLSNLRHRLESNRRFKEHCHQALVQQAANVIQHIDDQQGVQAMDAEGNELADRIDTAYWTNGAYSILVEQAHQAYEVIQNLPPLDLNEMAEWQQELAILAERGLELVTQARLGVLASQLRYNVAQIVVQALESQGFYLETSTYEANDFRGAVIAQTRNKAGNEVVVTIDPDPGLDEGGRLSIASSDASKVTEHVLNQRTLQIYEAIQSYGVQVRTPEVPGRRSNLPQNLPAPTKPTAGSKETVYPIRKRPA